MFGTVTTDSRVHGLQRGKVLLPKLLPLIAIPAVGDGVTKKNDVDLTRHGSAVDQRLSLNPPLLISGHRSDRFVGGRRGRLWSLSLGRFGWLGSCSRCGNCHHRHEQT